MWIKKILKKSVQKLDIDPIKDSVILLDNIYTKYSNNRCVNLGIHAAMLDSNFSDNILIFLLIVSIEFLIPHFIFL